MSNLLLVQVIVYGFALWFGLYLLGRSQEKPSLQFAGLGLVTYALGLALTSLSRYAPPLGSFLTRWYPLVALLPASFWFGAVWSLLPQEYRAVFPARRLVWVIPILLLVVCLAVISGTANLGVALTPSALVLVALWWAWRASGTGLPPLPLKVLFTATIFFAFGSTALALPASLISNELVVLGIGGDLVLLGYAIGKLDAYDEGTALLPDALRSLIGVGVVGVLVGSQLLWFISANGVDVRGVLLLYSALSMIILFHTWHSAFQKLLDRLFFGARARVVTEREVLAAVTDALPRQDDSLNLLTLADAEFARLTRRALSHYNDLGKLSASPLTRLPIISERLQADHKADTSLERAHELRRVLVEHILRLKPYSDKDFDPGEDWRYYNVLYFPYVMGLKPYAVRPHGQPLDAMMQAAQVWFQTYVPERTLYNWQGAASKLIARQLREADKDAAKLAAPGRSSTGLNIEKH
jgi:hypothetical protein